MPQNAPKMKNHKMAHKCVGGFSGFSGFSPSLGVPRHKPHIKTITTPVVRTGSTAQYWTTGLLRL